MKIVNSKNIKSFWHKQTKVLNAFQNRLLKTARKNYEERFPYAYCAFILNIISFLKLIFKYIFEDILNTGKMMIMIYNSLVSHRFFFCIYLMNTWIFWERWGLKLQRMSRTSDYNLKWVCFIYSQNAF